MCFVHLHFYFMCWHICFFSWKLRLYHAVDCCIPILTSTYHIMSVCFVHIDVNIIELYATFIQVRGLASYKTKFNQLFLPTKTYMPNQSYDGCYPFIWCVWAFEFAIFLCTFRLEFSSEFGIVFHFTFFLWKYCLLHWVWKVHKKCQYY